MPRRLRLFIPNTPCHIVQRGNNKSKIFLTSGNYQTFLGILQEAIEKYSCLLYSYCLMPNHFHLIVSPGKFGNISLFMKLLGGKYVRYINKKYARTGTLWESRFRSFLIGNEQYFVKCLRYVEMNPVRAGITGSSELYPWSSYRFKAGKEKNPLISLDPWYINLDSNPIERQLKYQQFFQKPFTEQELTQIREIVHTGGIFGNESFKEYVEEISKKSIVIRAPGRPVKIKELNK